LSSEFRLGRTGHLLLGAVVAIVLLNLVLLSTPFGQLNYDTETHLFFADHYRRLWFDPWEVKWYGGMWVWSYPPLAHQLIALLGMPWTVDVGYKIVQAASLVALPGAMWFFADRMVGRRYAGWAALLTAFVPGLYISLYSWGQLPSLVAMDLALVALGFLAGLTVTVRLARRSGLNPELITNLAVYVALAGLAAAGRARLLREEEGGTYTVAHDVIREVVEADLVAVVFPLRLRLAEADRRSGAPEVPNGLVAFPLHLAHPVPSERPEEIPVEGEAALDRRDDQIDVVNTVRAHVKPARDSARRRKLLPDERGTA